MIYGIHTSIIKKSVSTQLFIRRIGAISFEKIEQIKEDVKIVIDAD